LDTGVSLSDHNNRRIGDIEPLDKSGNSTARNDDLLRRACGDGTVIVNEVDYTVSSDVSFRINGNRNRSSINQRSKNVRIVVDDPVVNTVLILCECRESTLRSVREIDYRRINSVVKDQVDIREDNLISLCNTVNIFNCIEIEN